MKYRNSSFGFTLFLVILVAVLILPLVGAAAEPASTNTAVVAEEITGGNSFYNPDALSSDPEMAQIQQKIIEEIPEQFAPRLLS
ncbi:MAG: hypothetical protein JW738_07870, partial [Actinobacteria bacterium]|nr:hypothetical protein [Actinomycetota bacterium]